MSKPIKLTDDLLKKIQAEFIENVKSAKMFDGKISYTRNFKWEDAENEKAVITFTPVAFAKMVMLLQHFDSEVAWHGMAYRDNEQSNLFYITDILVYPQLVSGATVNTDQGKYTEWMYGLDNDTFNNLKMQGHSHVSFDTRPSPVDTAHQESILKQLDDDMFYIFMIWNKKFEHTIKIYDMPKNTLYEDGDITVFIGNEGVDLDAFIKDAKETVKPKYQYGGGYNQTAQQTRKATAPTTTAPTNKNGGGKAKEKTKEKEKPAIGRGWRGAQDWDEDEYSGYLNQFTR